MPILIKEFTFPVLGIYSLVRLLFPAFPSAFLTALEGLQEIVVFLSIITVIPQWEVMKFLQFFFENSPFSFPNFRYYFGEFIN